MKALIVTNPFCGYEHGQLIADKSVISEVLNSEHAQHVMLTDVPETAPKEATK